MLSNTVIAETPISGNKENPESANLNFQASADTTVSEKISVVQCTDEKPPLPIPENPKVYETVVVTENECVVDNKPEESVVIVIQTAIRGFMVLSNFFESMTVCLLAIKYPYELILLLTRRKEHS